MKEKKKEWQRSRLSTKKSWMGGIQRVDIKNRNILEKTFFKYLFFEHDWQTDGQSDLHTGSSLLKRIFTQYLE